HTRFSRDWSSDVCSSDLTEARKQVAASIADETRLEKQAAEQAVRSQEWVRRAMLALRPGDEGLAKEALARKKEHDATREQFLEQIGRASCRGSVQICVGV